MRAWDPDAEAHLWHQHASHVNMCRDGVIKKIGIWLFHGPSVMPSMCYAAAALCILCLLLAKPRPYGLLCVMRPYCSETGWPFPFPFICNAM